VLTKECIGEYLSVKDRNYFKPLHCMIQSELTLFFQVSYNSICRGGFSLCRQKITGRFFRTLRKPSLRAYRPFPVKLVEIPKPNCVKWLLGIHIVMDRLIQQAVDPQLSKQWD